MTPCVPHLCNVRASSSALLSMKRSGSLASTRKTIPKEYQQPYPQIYQSCSHVPETSGKYCMACVSLLCQQRYPNSDSHPSTNVLPAGDLFATSAVCSQNSSMRLCIPPKSKVVKRTLPMLNSSEAMCHVSHVCRGVFGISEAY